MPKINGSVRLVEFDRSNIKAVLALDVTDVQKIIYPLSNAYSIAEGHYPSDGDPVWMRAIYVGDVPVGFIMTSEAPTQGDYFLWRLMVDAQYQGNGFGFRAVELLIDRINATGKGRVLITSHLEHDGNAGPFYKKLGFAYTGEKVGGDDLLMERKMT